MAKNEKPGRIKAALQDWLGVPIGLTSGEFWSEWAGRSSSGKSVSVNGALQLSAVWSCVRLLSETISTLPLRVYHTAPDGTRTIASSHPMTLLLTRSPNREMTPARFKLSMLASLALWGNAYVEKRRLGQRVVALDPLLPQRMTVSRKDSGRLKYSYSDPLTDTVREIDEKDMMHIRGFGVDGMCGLQPISKGRDVLGGAMAVDDSANKMFAKGMQASGILSSENTLKGDQREKLQKGLERFMGSENAGKVMVTEAGMKYQSITMNPEAAQMLQTRSFGIEEICRWFRVPPVMVGHMDKQSSWASSVEGLNMQFLTNTLRPVLVNIEQEISRCLLGNDPEYSAEFSVEGLLRADSAGRAEFYSKMTTNGIMSRNEVRKLENLPPIDGGDILTVQSAMMALRDVGADDEARNQ